MTWSPPITAHLHGPAAGQTLRVKFAALLLALAQSPRPPRARLLPRPRPRPAQRQPRHTWYINYITSFKYTIIIIVLGYCVTIPAVASLTEFLDSRLAADREPEDPGGWFSSAAMWFLLLNCCRSLLHGPITGEQVVT